MASRTCPPHVAQYLLWFGIEYYLHGLQGEGRRNLGTFKDPVEAAKCYDRAAIEAHGANAVLNFPPVPKVGPIFSGKQRQRPVVPVGKGHGKDGLATNGRLPAGNGDSRAVPEPL
jgi:hypothetical protein